MWGLVGVVFGGCECASLCPSARDLGFKGWFLTVGDSVVLVGDAGGIGAGGIGVGS